MPAIGIDTHKRTLAACAVDDVGSVIDERTFDCDQAGFVELAAWAGGVAPEGRIGIEGSASYGAPVAHHLIAAGFVVREVPPHLSRRERGRSRRPGKSDPGDALAIARVTLREPDLPPVRLEDRSTELGLLADARDDLVHAQTRARNRLHAHLVILMPGYGRTTAQLISGRQLETIERAIDGQAGGRAELARALLAEVRDLGRRAAELERSMTALVAGHPLLGLPGVGPLTAARLVAETGDVARFRSPPGRTRQGVTVTTVNIPCLKCPGMLHTKTYLPGVRSTVRGCEPPGSRFSPSLTKVMPAPSSRMVPELSVG